MARNGEGQLELIAQLGVVDWRNQRYTVASNRRVLDDGFILFDFLMSAVDREQHDVSDPQEAGGQISVALAVVGRSRLIVALGFKNTALFGAVGELEFISMLVPGIAEVLPDAPVLKREACFIPCSILRDDEYALVQCQPEVGLDPKVIG